MLMFKQKKNQNSKGNRLLVSITVLGSAGPIRLVVHEDDLVASVIDMALKSYAREGRFPVLSSDLNDFHLYCPIAGPNALSPWETIGSQGARNFMLCKKPQPEKTAANGMLCKKPQPEKTAADGSPIETMARKGSSGSWKSWFNKSPNSKISSH